MRNPVVSGQHSNLSGDAQPFRVNECSHRPQPTRVNKSDAFRWVTEAAIQSYADVVELSSTLPRLEPASINPLGLTDSPRFNALVFADDRWDPTQMERARVHSLCAPNMQEV